MPTVDPFDQFPLRPMEPSIATARSFFATFVLGAIVPGEWVLSSRHELSAEAGDRTPVSRWQASQLPRTAGEPSAVLFRQLLEPAARSCGGARDKSGACRSESLRMPGFPMSELTALVCS